MIALAHFPVLMLAAMAQAAPEAAPAHEEAPRGGLVVETAGQCPGRDAVMAALRPVLGDETLRSTPGVSRVSDLGDRFEVVALGQTRQYPDPARDCAERARVAAVFITLVVKPPMFEMPAPPPPRPVRVVAPPPPLVVPPAPGPVTWVSLGAAARLDGGSSVGSTDVAAGAELSAAVGRASVGVVATAAILAPTETRLSSVVVHQQRFPCSAGVIGRRALARLEGAISAGIAVVPFTLRGDGLAVPEPATRVDVGARLAVELRFPMLDRRMTPFVDLHGELFPRPYTISVDPLGDIGSTGHFWLGAAAGVSFDTRR